jgi:Zn-dependent metalloprotease
MANAHQTKASAPQARMKTEGFAVFSLHRTEASGRRTLDRLAKERRTVPVFALTKEPKAVDTETAAKFILTQVLDHADWLPQLARPSVGDSESAFQSLGTEFVPLTGTKVVKFRQFIEGVPVYGTLITIEFDEQRNCLALNATVATPKIRDHVAKIAPMDALGIAAERAGYGNKKPARTPMLVYYLSRRGKWHLAYMVRDVRVHQGRDQTHGRRKRMPLMFDYVVDATSGRLLAELPRTPSFVAVPQQAEDDCGKMRRFRAAKKAGQIEMFDPELNVATYDFTFRDPRAGSSGLPGKECVRPPWEENRAAVSAHVNAATVVSYLRQVLKRNNIDNKGGRVVSVVNCVVKADAKGHDRKIWQNGFWDGKQMVYGQDEFDGQLRSYASNLDVVAHELFHGVSSRTARLEYLYETGALNESYSDIFGILISNWGRERIRSWDWKMGDGLSDAFEAARDFSNPDSGDLNDPQVRHYEDFEDWRSNQDKGGVHHFSGIHNYAAYRIMDAKHNGRHIFKPNELAAIFYIALTQHLARQATFSASRRAVVLATRSYFRKLKPAALELRVRAVERSFAAAGIY